MMWDRALQEAALAILLYEEELFESGEPRPLTERSDDDD